MMASRREVDGPAVKRERVEAIVRQGLIQHRAKRGGRVLGGIVEHCECSAAVLDHLKHQAEKICDAFEEAGIIHD